MLTSSPAWRTRGGSAEYDALRHPVDCRVVHQVEFFSRLVSEDTWYFDLIRRYVFPTLAKTLLQARIKQTVSGLDHELPADLAVLPNCCAEQRSRRRTIRLYYRPADKEFACCIVTEVAVSDSAPSVFSQAAADFGMRLPHESERSFILNVVQPGLAGLMDGSVSSLAPLFAAAFATRDSSDGVLGRPGDGGGGGHQHGVFRGPVG